MLLQVVLYRCYLNLRFPSVTQSIAPLLSQLNRIEAERQVQAEQRTIPMRIETTSGTPVWTPTRPEIPALPELTEVLDALQRNAMRLEPGKAKEGIGMRVAEGHMALPTAARQLLFVRQTSESITDVEGTAKPSTRTD